MIKKRNQLITLIATPTKDLRGLNGVSSGAVFGPHFGAKILDFGSNDFGPNIAVSDIASTDVAKSGRTLAFKGNLPIA